jgi:tripeptide aminopeptidase
MINKERLAETFQALVKINSVSKNEKAFSDALLTLLEPMGAEIIFDNAGEKIGSNTGNMIVRFAGNVQAPPLLLSAHMDTVEPGIDIKPILKDGVFTSDGTTILGADDKSAIAIILETMMVIQENQLPCSPMELVFTVCEEIGLMGSKHLDFSLLKATHGYVLDTNDTEGIVTRAPAANRLEFTIHGKDAHAGVCPEEGINAIALAGQAIAPLQLGRIDHETTCNIGMIEGGIATNIVPNFVTVKGEVRSHNQEKLDATTNSIVRSFQDVVNAYPTNAAANGLPRLDVLVENDFPLTHIPNDHQVVGLAMAASSNLNKKMEINTSGGGADANIFFEKGIMTGVLGTGMRDMHSVRESIRLDDMVTTSELLLEIIRLHSKGL